MGGMEMMLGQMLKSLGVNPEQIAGIATGLEEALKSLIAGQAKIIKQNERILRHLGLETIQEEMEQDDGRGNGNAGIGAGGNPDNRNGGTDPGTGTRIDGG